MPPLPERFDDGKTKHQHTKYIAEMLFNLFSSQNLICDLIFFTGGMPPLPDMRQEEPIIVN